MSDPREQPTIHVDAQPLAVQAAKWAANRGMEDVARVQLDPSREAEWIEHRVARSHHGVELLPPASGRDDDTAKNEVGTRLKVKRQSRTQCAGIP